MPEILRWFFDAHGITGSAAATALFVRVFTGFLLVKYHGLHKLADFRSWRAGGRPHWPLADEVAAAGFPFPVPSALLATFAQLFGGGALILGFAVRPAALLVLGTMAGALFTNFLLRKDQQLALLYVGLLVAVVLLGAGPFSIDRLLLR